MRKDKLVIHECYAGKRKSEEVFAAVFLSNAAALTESTKPSIIELTDRSQDSLCSGKGANNRTSRGSWCNWWRNRSPYFCKYPSPASL